MLRAPCPQASCRRAVSCSAFRPCIDIHAGKVKQIVGSSLRDAASGAAETPVTNFETDKSAAEYARMYREDGLAGGHVIMLSQDEQSRAAALAALAAYPGGLQARPPLRAARSPAPASPRVSRGGPQVGGGVTAENASAFLDAGASHVVVTSYVFRDGGLDEERLRQLVRAHACARARGETARLRAGSDDKTYLRRRGGPNQAAPPAKDEKKAKRLAIDPRRAAADHPPTPRSSASCPPHSARPGALGGLGTAGAGPVLPAAGRR